MPLRERSEISADADLAMSASSTRNLKRVLPADHSDDEDVAGNSSDEELELEQIENKETFSLSTLANIT